jgi:predicted site-specific integrase-resolvase
MPIRVNEQTYYKTAEVCQETRISRATLYRWLRAGLLDRSYIHRRGWRLFTKDDMIRIRMEASRIEVKYTSLGDKNAERDG